MKVQTYYQNGKWHSIIVEVGRLGQVTNRLFHRVCKDQEEAKQQGELALAYLRSKAQSVG